MYILFSMWPVTVYQASALDSQQWQTHNQPENHPQELNGKTKVIMLIFHLLQSVYLGAICASAEDTVKIVKTKTSKAVKQYALYSSLLSLRSRNSTYSLGLVHDQTVGAAVQPSVEVEVRSGSDAEDPVGSEAAASVVVVAAAASVACVVAAEAAVAGNAVAAAVNAAGACAAGFAAVAVAAVVVVAVTVTEAYAVVTVASVAAMHVAAARAA